MSRVEEILHRCLSGTRKGDLTAQNVSFYHTSPYAIYCEKFVPEENRNPMSPYRELLHERGTEHEKKVIETSYPEGEAVEYKEPEEGFMKLLVAMARGREVICGLPLFYLPENMQGIIDILQKRAGHSSVFGDYRERGTLLKNITLQGYGGDVGSETTYLHLKACRCLIPRSCCLNAL